MAEPVKLKPRPPQVQVIGLCRFSFLCVGSFQTLPDGNLEEKRAMLFDPHRLDARMIWFEHVFLPALKAQTDPDFLMLVLLSDELPAPYRAGIEALIKGLPQFRLCSRAVGPHRETCAEVLGQFIDTTADATAQFRLDDDDAVSVDYVARIRHDFAGLAGFYRQKQKLALDYGKGVILCDDLGKVSAIGRYTNTWTPGLTLFLPPGHPKTVLDYPHYKVMQQMVTITMDDAVMFVRGSHDNNDSSVHTQGPKHPVKTAEAAALLQDRFRIDLAGFTSALARYHRGSGIAAAALRPAGPQS